MTFIFFIAKIERERYQQQQQQSISATIKGADAPTGTLTTSYVMDALTGEIELSKSGFSKGVVKYALDSTARQNATVASLSNPLDGLKVSNSTVFGQVGVKSEITKQLKGTLSACYVSGPGAMGVETAISKKPAVSARRRLPRSARLAMLCTPRRQR